MSASNSLVNSYEIVQSKYHGLLGLHRVQKLSPSLHVKYLIFIIFIALYSPVAKCQLKFEEQFIKSGDQYLESFNARFHGLSAIEYNTKTRQWVIASDRGPYFKIHDLDGVPDFNAKNQPQEISTNHYFESIRYDSTRNVYFFSVEGDRHTAVYIAHESLESPDLQLLLKIPLPCTNKGIEAIALTPSGALWIAPEAGWEGETKLTTNRITFFRYKNTLLDAVDRQPDRFEYPITKFPGAAEASDVPGGISEILAVNESNLLVLERCFFKNPDRVEAFLRNVFVDEINHKLVIGKDAFDFKSLPNVCNVEGMAWSQDKKNLYIIADDGLGFDFYNDQKRVDGSYKKPTLRTQFIALRRSTETPSNKTSKK